MYRVRFNLGESAASSQGERTIAIFPHPKLKRTRIPPGIDFGSPKLYNDCGHPKKNDHRGKIAGEISTEVMGI